MRGAARGWFTGLVGRGREAWDAHAAAAVKGTVESVDAGLVGLVRWSAAPPAPTERGLRGRLRGWGAARHLLLRQVADRWRTQVEKICPTGFIMLPPYTIPPLVIQIGERGANQPQPPAPPPPVGVLYCGFSLDDIKCAMPRLHPPSPTPPCRPPALGPVGPAALSAPPARLTEPLRLCRARRTLFAATSQVYLGLSEIVKSGDRMEQTMEELEQFREEIADGNRSPASPSPAPTGELDIFGNPIVTPTPTPVDGDYAADYGDYGDYA